MSEEKLRSIKEILTEIERMQTEKENMKYVPVAHESGSLDYVIGRIAGLCFAIGIKVDYNGEVIENGRRNRE